MKITYDREADALALILKKGRISKDTQIAENVYAGFDRANQLIEIQLLDISKYEIPWFTLEAAAKYLRVSERTLLRWIKGKKLSPSKIGREYRIKPEELEKIAA